MSTTVSTAAKPRTPLRAATEEAAAQAAVIFQSAWSHIAESVESGTARLPREIIWLGGAPGAGKGTNTPFILRERGITAPPIVTSDLLNAPEMRKIKDAGNLVGDADVVRLLFERLLEPAHATGVVIDGFPRTRVQVECVRRLYEKILELRTRYRGTPRAALFPKPSFEIVVLYVGEKESVERQLARGRETIVHNQRVRDTGVGELREERATDLSEDACRKRYRVFMEQTYDVLQSLKETFHFHVINAQSDVASVERAIISEFSYQSSLELDEETFDAVRDIPLASEIVLSARQHLVERLEGYQRDHTALFHDVIGVINRDFVPAIVVQAVTGIAELTTDNDLFVDPLARRMLVDILNERGYRTTASVQMREVPARVDRDTFEIVLTAKARYHFQVQFQGSQIRRGN
jgi:adenylate kinase